ncbi:Sterile alpha motif domain-containing protein 9-like [Mizuhopecten yessoensis]|uniref:Sterile alpha motif domain-containing protein 9-like n=2 Tax=Mizuhopecten yessoensis TaxID=6573 RepID=A0A210QWG6_MIZYE|nr:Sterile alpha motif domain-containing protein 9-like [Mizuhopecten yessoensis]
MQIAELLSGKTDLTKEGLDRDDLLQGSLNSILNPKHSKAQNPMQLKKLEKKFTETFGDNLPAGKKTFASAAGISLDSFLQRHNDSYETFITSKGKTMVQQRQTRLTKSDLFSGVSSETQVKDRDPKHRVKRCDTAGNIVTQQKGKALDGGGNQSVSITGQVCQSDNNSEEWKTVSSKRHKKLTKTTKQSIKSGEHKSMETKQHECIDPWKTFMSPLLERRNRQDLKFVSDGGIYFQNFLLFTIDVISMWNTPKEASSYIIIGIVDNGADGSVPYAISGMKKSRTIEHFKKIFLYDCIIGSVPEFSYSEVLLGNDAVGVIEIFSSRGNQTPCVLSCDRENNALTTREGDMWIRKGASNIVCKPTDETFAKVYRWFAESHVENANHTVASANEQYLMEEAKRKEDPINFVHLRQPNAISKNTANELKVCTSVDQMLDAVNNFRKGHYVLFAGDVPGVLTNIDAIALVPWLTVFDFDPYSRDGGLLCSNEEPLSKRTSLQITTWKTINKPVSEYGTNWCFVRGSRDDPESRQSFQEPDDLRNWSRKIKPFVDPYLDNMQAFIADYTVLTSVVIWPKDEQMLPHILKMVNKLDENIDPPPKLVIILDSEPSTEAGKTSFCMLCDEQNENLTLIRMKLSDVLDGLTRTLKRFEKARENAYDLPAADQSDACISDRDVSWVREHLNVLFKSSPFVHGENDIEFLQEESDNFHRGGTLDWRTWYACKAGHFDAERDIYKNGKAAIELNIQNNKSGMVTLCHAPGAGGTTLAQRLAWDFHEKVPTVHVRKNSINLMDIVSRIEFIYIKTRKPVLLLIDGEDETKVFHLMQYLKTSCISIILFVKRCLRRPQSYKGEPEKLWLSGIVSAMEAKQLTLKLTTHCKDDEGKKRALVRLCKETEQGKQHHLINFGLTVFMHEFKGVSSFVKGYLPVTEHGTSPAMDQKILLYLALAYFYGHSSIPCQFFNELLCLPANYYVDLEDFPHPIQSFVVEDEGAGKKSNIRICHNLVAKEILDHILTRGKKSKYLRQDGLSGPARHRLASLCLDFISYASRREKRSSASANTVVNCLKRIFIVRETIDMTGKSEHLTRRPLISNVLLEIESQPPMFCERAEVLKKLAEAFPDDPIFLAHLGRFYANCLPHKEKEAEKCFVKSLELCEVPTKGINTGEGKLYDRWKHSLMYIYHMYGTFLLKRIKRDTGNGTFDDVANSLETGKSSGSIEDLLALVQQACLLFENSRKYTPVGHESGYGYTGEIEVRLHLCDFLQKEETVTVLDNTLPACTSTRERADVFIRKSIPIIDQLINECTKESTGQKEIGYYINKYTCWYDRLFRGKKVALEHPEDCQDIDSCRLKISMTKLSSKTGTRNSCNIIDNIRGKGQIDDTVKLYERIFEIVDHCDTYREKKALETNLVDWLRAIRHREMTEEYSIEKVLVEVAKINNLLSSPVSKFYIFVLQSLLGFGICSKSGHVDTGALYDAKQLKLELKASGSFVLKPKHPREWVGNSENGIKCLLPGSQCMSLLQVFKGSICHPNKKRFAGFINLDLGENTCPVEVFFIPDVVSMAGSQHVGRRVEFTLAFSIENGYEAFHVTYLKKYKCTNFPCGGRVEITSADEFGVCCACNRKVCRNDFFEETN